MGMCMSAKRNLCPVCEKPQAPEFKPFCSQGCKDRDLIKWLDEGYRVPGPAAEYQDSLNDDEED